MSRCFLASLTSHVLMWRTVTFLAMAGGVASCGGSESAPTAPTPPTPPQPPAQVQLAVFSDTASSFSTSDVRDVQEQIVRFDVASNSLIWKADGRTFPGYPVSGNFVASDKHFQIRFGTKDGERRAYFTETASATICDIEVTGGQLSISPTTVTVPGGG
jgi:hypothetical protein